MRFVYILSCADDSLYIGETDDVPGRVARHNDGRGSSFTASRLRVRLVSTEVYKSRDEVLAREKQLRRWTRKKKDALIAGNCELLKLL